MNTLNKLTLPCLAGCLISLSISSPATAKDKPAPSVGYGVGNVAPELQMVKAQGGTLALSSLRGRYVILDLSAMWCDPSERAGAGVRDAVSRLNAESAIRREIPAVWITAEFDGALMLSSPSPGSLARFAQKFGIGDALSPVVSFGPFSSQTRQAAADQFYQYSASFPFAGYPTFIVIDPAGVIVDILQGFLSTEYGDLSTLTHVMADLGAKDVKYELRRAPYADLAHTLSALDVSTTIDGVVDSARLELPGASFHTSSDSQFVVEAAWQEYPQDTLATTATYVDISRADAGDLDLDSTYQLALRAVVSPNAPFTGMSQVSGALVFHFHALSDPTREEWLRLPMTLGADGQIPPFELADLVDLLQSDIDQDFGEPVGVSEIFAETEWDGPVASGFGTNGKL